MTLVYIDVVILTPLLDIQSVLMSLVSEVFSFTVLGGCFHILHTLSCPVKHCEEPPVITWCKMMDVDNCTSLAENPNVTIWQQMPADTEENIITSYMEIKNITKNDIGLYRCNYSQRTAAHSIFVYVTGKWSFFFYCFGQVFSYIILYIKFTSV